MERIPGFCVALGCLSVSVTVLLSACKEAPPATQQSAVQAAAPSPQPAAAAATGFAGGAGKVVETMDAGGYTYIELELAGGNDKVWVAGPQTLVKVGDTVTVSGGAPMVEFFSKTLNRTFDVIYFVGQVTPALAAAAGGTAAAAAPAMPADGGVQQGAPVPGGAGAPKLAQETVTGIARAPGGKTVAEVFASKTQLAGQAVAVRGKVVKFNAQILGKNWIHLQDGTGDANSYDLTVTTNDTVAVGDVVAVRGTVAVNKDFGAGYAYDVVLEDASVMK